MKRPSVAGSAADPTVEFAVLEIDEQKYKLAWDFNALALAEEKTGVNLLDGMAGFFLNTATLSQYRGLLWAAMLKAHPGTTIEQAGMLLHAHNLPDIRRALAQAYNLSLPEKKRIKITEAKPAAKDKARGRSGGTTGQQPESISS